MIRTKFQCISVADTIYGGQLEFEAVHEDSPENAQFFSATPGGSIRLIVVRPEALRQFLPGRTYYVDFTPAAK